MSPPVRWSFAGSSPSGSRKPSPSPKPSFHRWGKLRATEWDKGGDESVPTFPAWGGIGRKHGEGRMRFEAGFDQPKIARDALGEPPLFNFFIGEVRLIRTVWVPMTSLSVPLHPEGRLTPPKAFPDQRILGSEGKRKKRVSELIGLPVEDTEGFLTGQLTGSDQKADLFRSFRRESLLVRSRNLHPPRPGRRIRKEPVQAWPGPVEADLPDNRVAHRCPNRRLLQRRQSSR